MSTISELQIKIGADSSGLSSSLNKAKGDIDKTFAVNPITEMNTAVNNLNGSVSGLIGKFNGLVGLAAGGFGISAAIQSAVDAGDAVYTLSQRMNVSAGEASEFSRILKITGGDAGTTAKAMMRLDKSYSDDSESGKKCKAILDAVGVSLTDQSGKLLPVTQQLGNLSEGYKKAQAAGMGQEFIMNTLGARGMTLITTLERYNEAKESASKVQGIGLNPEEMHKMSVEMKELEMQAGQLKIAAGSILVDIFHGQGGQVSGTLAYWAKLIADNRTQIASTTAEALKLLAAYEAIKVARTVGNSMMGAWNSHSATADLNAINASQEAALTAQQERSIVKRQAMIDGAAKKEEVSYYKTVQAMEVSEAEKTAIFTEYLLKREQASLESQAAIRTSMTEMYLQTNVAAEESATAQAAAMNNVAVTAEETAARVAAANAAQAESSAVVIAAEGEKAAAMVEAGEVGVVAAEETTAANMALSEAEIAAGSAAAVAGEQAVAGATAATVATGESTLATTELTGATALAGAEAMATGEKTVASCAVATTATKALTFAVSLLKSQWMLVALAIYEAINALVAYNKAKAQETQSNDGVKYSADGKEYALKNGDFYEVEETTNVRTDREGFEHPYTTRSISDTPVDRDSDTFDTLNTQFNDAHANDSDVKALYKQQELEADQERLKASLQNSMSRAGAGSDKGAGTTATPKVTTHDIQTAVGDVASAIAANHPDGEQWMGNVTSNPSIQCDSFTANVYNQAGISSIGGVDTSSSTINDSAFRAAGAYHAVGDGYVPQNGDLVDFANHVGIYKDGNVISRQSSAGVHTATMTEAESYFGSVKGYGSVSEATGGQTVTQTVDAEGKKIADAAAKLAKAKEDAYKLFDVMSNKILEENGTAYQTGMNKVNDDVQAKQQQINKLKTAGLDVSALEKELGIYKQVLDEKVVKTWHDAWYKIKDDTRKTLDEMTGDYEDEARMQYDATIRALDDERKERLKAIQQSSNDYVAKLAVDKWYNVEVMKAADDRDKALAEAHNKMIKQWADQGDYNKILLNLNSHPEQRQKDIDLDGQKKLASEVVKIWDAAHQSIDADLAEGADALYGSLTDSVEGFIQGTKSAIDIVHSFGNTILSEISRIAAQKFAGQIIGGLFGNLLGGSSGSGGYGISPISGMSLPTAMDSGSGGYGISASTTGYTLGDLSVPHFANGGIVTAPTLGLIGEAGKNEAVIPLDNDNLSAIGGNKGATGGVVVNITNNSDAQPKVANQRYDSTLNRMVLDIVIDGAQRNVGGFNTNLKTALKG